MLIALSKASSTSTDRDYLLKIPISLHDVFKRPKEVFLKAKVSEFSLL